jgi:cytochrome c biogenesis protein CcdA
MLVSFGLAFLAGVLSVFSPCVLPLLPIVFGTAAGEHRLGPVALAFGVALSFVAIGLFVATIGFSVGLDGDVFRQAAAILLLLLGIVLVVPNLQTRLSAAAGPVGNWANQQFGGVSTCGLQGQFGVGLLLGMIWSPCVGPTLGAASVLAAQGRDLGQVALTMVLFGLGAALPLLLLGLLSRETFRAWRGHLTNAGSGFKIALGIVLIATACSLLFGFDKAIEASLVAASPDWLTNLTTRF